MRAAEAVEGRGPAKGNTASETRPGPSAGHERAQCAWSCAPSGSRRTRKRGSPRSCTTSTSIACGRRTGRSSPRPRRGWTGSRGGTTGRISRTNLRDLHSRVHRGAYRARPSRRVYIPKADGRLRPLGVAALEDKILQRAVVEVLNAIYGKRRTTGMRKGMRGSHIEVLATHGGPEPCVGDPRGRSEALDRGARRPAIEPRNAFGRGADAIVDDGRQHRWRRFREPSADPAGSKNPSHACDLLMLRTGRSDDHPPVVMVGRVVRGRPRP